MPTLNIEALKYPRVFSGMISLGAALFALSQDPQQGITPSSVISSPAPELSSHETLSPEVPVKFINRITDSPIEAYGITPDHLGFYVDPYHAWVVARKDLRFSGIGVNLMRLDPAMAEFERWTIDMGPTTTGERIEQDIQRMENIYSKQSPMHGLGQFIYDTGLKYGVDPALAAAIAHAESNWGLESKSIAVKNKNPMSLRHWPGRPESNGFAVFNSYKEGFEAGIKNLLGRYIQRNLIDIHDVMEVYAPRFENDTDGYITILKTLISWLRRDTRPGAMIGRIGKIIFTILRETDR